MAKAEMTEENIISSTILNKTQVITDTVKIEKTLRSCHHYNLSIVEYKNSTSTLGKRTPIGEIASNKEIPGNPKQKGYRAYLTTSQDEEYFFFQLDNIFSIEISENFSYNKEKDGKITDRPLQRDLTIFFI